MIRPRQWVRRPAEMPPGELIRQMRERLSAAGPAGVVEGLTVIDPAAKVTYYRGRWRPLKPADSGLFVARRPQAYGADLWCVVLVAGGAPVRLLDLPADDPAAPGSRRGLARPGRARRRRAQPSGVPRRRRCGTGASAGRTVDFFSPLPRWAERYLQLTGMAVPRTAGALCSYRVPEGAHARPCRFPCQDMLWMRQINDGGAE